LAILKQWETPQSKLLSVGLRTKINFIFPFELKKKTMAGYAENSGDIDNEIESNISAKNTDISSVTKESSTSTDQFQGVGE
jgi:hypothetical protein